MSGFQEYVRKPEFVQARKVTRPELVQTKTGLARVKPGAWLVLRDDGRCDVWSDRAFDAMYELGGDSTDQPGREPRRRNWWWCTDSGWRSPAPGLPMDSPGGPPLLPGDLCPECGTAMPDHTIGGGHFQCDCIR